MIQLRLGKTLRSLINCTQAARSGKALRSLHGKKVMAVADGMLTSNREKLDELRAHSPGLPVVVIKKSAVTPRPSSATTTTGCSTSRVVIGNRENGRGSGPTIRSIAAAAPWHAAHGGEEATSRTGQNQHAVSLIWFKKRRVANE
jgi:hypothetical protein